MSAAPSAETRAAVQNSNTSGVQAALARAPSEAPWVLQQLVHKRAWKALFSVFVPALGHPFRETAQQFAAPLNAWVRATRGQDVASPLERVLCILLAAALCHRDEDADELALRYAGPHIAALGRARAEFWQLVRQLAARRSVKLADLALRAYEGAAFASQRERESSDVLAGGFAHYAATQWGSGDLADGPRASLDKLLADADAARTRDADAARSALAAARDAVHVAAAAGGGGHLVYSVAGFGSVTTGLAGANSDLDLCALVAQPEAASPSPSESSSASDAPHTPAGFLALVAKGLAANPALTAGAKRSPQLLTETRITLLRACLRLPQASGPDTAPSLRRVDVVVNAVPSLANSALVAAVLEAGDARTRGALRPALRAALAWARKRKLTGHRPRCASSHALTVALLASLRRAGAVPDVDLAAWRSGVREKVGARASAPPAARSSASGFATALRRLAASVVHWPADAPECSAEGPSALFLAALRLLASHDARDSAWTLGGGNSDRSDVLGRIAAAADSEGRDTAAVAARGRARQRRRALAVVEDPTEEWKDLGQHVHHAWLARCRLECVHTLVAVRAGRVGPKQV